MGKLNSFFQLKRAWKVKCIAWKNIYERDFLNNRLEIYPHWVLIFKTYFDNQYRGSVELFNNNDILFGLKFTKLIGRKRWRYSNTYISKYIFWCFDLLVITVVSLFDYLRFKCNLFLLCVDAELNPGPKQNIVKKIIFATE